MVNLNVDNLGPFWAHLDTFGPFRTKINLLPHKDKLGFAGGAFEQKIIFRFKWSKRAQTGPKGSQKVKNILVDHFGFLLTPLDHFGMLTSLLGLAIFVCFIGIFFGHPVA